MEEIDPKAGWREQTIKTKLDNRKERLKEIISKKRLYPVQKQNQSAQQEHKISEGEEVPDQEEVGEPKGLMNLSKHAKNKKKRKSKKKCWRCKSPHHIKRNCPKIKCYYCGKLGHIKSNCYYMKTDKIYSWLMEMEQNYREHWQKKNQYKEHIKELLKETRYVKDGKEYNVLWKDQMVGKYIGPKKPTDIKKTLHHFESFKYNIKHVEVTVRKSIPIENLKLIEGFSNWCGCGTTGLGNKSFIKHVKDKHNGIVLSSSILNRPPWIDFIFFYTDEAEILYQGCND